MKSRTFRSFAKINLGLEVVGKLPNGYHELKTIFATVALHDLIEIGTARNGVTVRSDHPGVPNDASNLASRAALLMQELAGTDRGVSIRIEKRIPVGGGLGGGSSNAATVLRALDLIWKLGLGPSGLTDAAKKLGADVPYFLQGGPALGRGRGDDIHPLDLRLAEKVLLVPHQAGVSTAAVFRRFAMQPPLARARSPIDALLHGGADGARFPERPCVGLVNDLEAAALFESPALASVGEHVARVARQTGASHAAMSGSGSTFFLLHADTSSRRAAVRALKEEGIESVISSFLSARAYRNRFEVSAPR